MEIASMGITHKKALVEDIEKVFLLFSDTNNLSRCLFSYDRVKEFILLHTCNRVEIYIVTTGEDGKGVEILRDFVEKMKLPVHKDVIEFRGHEESILHLFRLASGIESMMIGEDQILGQIKDLYEKAKEEGTIGEILDIVFKRAIRVGKRVRSETKINEGAVSIGSAAVDLAESILGDLRGKVILVVGAGEMATLVAKALAKRDVKAIYVANRTFSHAKMLAMELGGHAVRFDELEHYMTLSDVVISATGAPHVIIKRDLVERVMEGRRERGERKMVIIDIANPRDVEEAVSFVPGVEVYTMDNLRVISERNKEKRKEEIKKVERIIEEEMEKLRRDYKLREANKVLKLLYEKAERIRRRECLRAINIINGLREDGHAPDKYEEVIENLTHSIVYKMLADVTEEIKRAAEVGEEERIALAKDLFRLEA
ncbi:MAG: glutamyl-tRNA reductase [Candidatus Methanospirareceae archaeon]